MSFLTDPVTFISQWLRTLLAGLGLADPWLQLVMYVLGAVVLVMCGLFFCLFLIWLERKIIGRIQDRLGPNRVGPWGIFQPVADMLKIFIKEYITPVGADLVPYNLAPVLSVAGVLMVWAVLPFAVTVYGVSLNVGVLYVIASTAIGELGVILAGWGSNNKYALLGAFRAVAQLISYEVPMIISLLVPVMLSGAMGLTDIVKAQDIWFIALAPVAALIFFITQVAEVGRAPFDLVEAESELVAGFNIEYSGLKFGMFFVAEFLHAFTISLVFATLFLGGWRGPGAETYPILGFVYYLIKTSVVYFVVILFRGALPRFRIDQMMDINWKLLTPISLAVVIFTAIADKLAAGSPTLVRVAVLLAVNLVLLLIPMETLRRMGANRKRALVGLKPITAEVHELLSSQPGTGA